MLGCAAPTAFNCIFNNTIDQKNKKILILGAGGVGLLAVYAAKILKFKEISVLDLNIEKLRLAKKLGAKNIKKIDNTKLDNYFDYVLECTGNSSILHRSIKLVKNLVVHYL